MLGVEFQEILISTFPCACICGCLSDVGFFFNDEKEGQSLFYFGSPKDTDVVCGLSENLGSSLIFCILENSQQAKTSE